MTLRKGEGGGGKRRHSTDHSPDGGDPEGGVGGEGGGGGGEGGVEVERRHCTDHTLRVSLSGTFLQTLPDLVTPLKGHSLSPHSCPPTRSAPSERFRY